jgi:8-oxo-dGTP pyrophosphatase MutT (NUDIX family)
MSGIYPTTVYRVSLKAVIRNEKGEVLVVKENSNNWDLPGGGIDHGESDTEGLRRELMEEVAYEGNFSASLAGIQTFFIEKHDTWGIWVVYNIKTETNDFGVGPDASEIAFTDPNVFRDSDKLSERLIYKFCVDMSAEITN